MMLEGRVLTPEEAHEAGLVHRTVEPAQLLEEAIATAERLARRSPAAVRALKRGGLRRRIQAARRGAAHRAGRVHGGRLDPRRRRALAAYVEEVGRLENGAPWQTGDLMARWQDGTAVDMVSG